MMTVIECMSTQTHGSLIAGLIFVNMKTETTTHQRRKEGGGRKRERERGGKFLSIVFYLNTLNFSFSLLMEKVMVLS